MTFKQLQIANESLGTMEIHGKDYVMVNQRIKAFRLLYPNGGIETEILSLEDGIVVMKATVRDDFGAVLGVGHAYEIESASKINNTSYIENCETSAVGRALGMVGIGVDTSVASAEEVENAIREQALFERINLAKVDTLKKCIPKHGQTIEHVCEYFGVENLSDLTVEQFEILMNRMGEK